jgi:hypothetical protein
MFRIIRRWFDRCTMAVLAILSGCRAEVDLPPNVVNDSGLHVFESICMSEYFDHGSCSKAMASHGHLVDRETIFPLRPVDSIQTSRGTAYITFAS